MKREGERRTKQEESGRTGEMMAMAIGKPFGPDRQPDRETDAGGEPYAKQMAA